MVKETTKSGKKYFKCEECGFVYKDESMSKKCEDYCKKHHACNIKIIKHAIKI